jgi:hypothetical protein
MGLEDIAVRLLAIGLVITLLVVAALGFIFGRWS